MFTKISSAASRKILIELLMLIVGINVALWFESKFEDYSDAETEHQYLEGLQDDLTQDLGRLERLIEFNKAKIERLQSALAGLAELADADQQTIAEAFFEPAGYDFFQPSDFTYRSMQESGDFRLLRDAELKRGVLRLAREYQRIEILQTNFIQALDDEYIPILMRNFDLIEMRLTQPAVVQSQVFRNFFAFSVQDTSGRVQAYQSARDQATKLLATIAQQL
jgi:hypothetical protein